MKFFEEEGLECKSELATSDNSPWVEPIFCEPLNVYPPVLEEETGFC